MGDRIAVLNDGVLQQVGTPEEVYKRPRNVFVAGFIGSPSMNLVPSATLDEEGDPGTILGIRPEHIELGDRGREGLHFRATVEVVEYLGDEQVVHLRVGEASLVAKLPESPRIERGQQLDFTVPRAKIYLFDAETGEALDLSGAPSSSREPDAADTAGARQRESIEAPSGPQ